MEENASWGVSQMKGKDMVDVKRSEERDRKVLEERERWPLAMRA